MTATIEMGLDQRIIAASQRLDAILRQVPSGVQSRYQMIAKELEAAHDSGDIAQQEEATDRFMALMRKGGAMGRVLQAHHTWSQLVSEAEIPDDKTSTDRLFPGWRNYPTHRPIHDLIIKRGFVEGQGLDVATTALQDAHDSATEEEYERYCTALQKLDNAPKWSPGYHGILRRIQLTIASENGVGRLLAAHREVSRYGQINPLIPTQ